MIHVAEYRSGPLPASQMPERDFRDILRIRLPLLVGEDRALMALYLDSGHSFRQLSRVIGGSPSTVARKIRKIARRLTDQTYPLCLRSNSEFNRSEQRIVRDHFVRGRSIEWISRRRGITFYRVRTTILKAKAFASSANGRCPRASDQEDNV